MCGNHLADRVCVDETSEEDKRYEMVVKNLGVKVKIGWDQGPGDEKGN